MRYNWEQRDWPKFDFDLTEVEPALLAFAEQFGRARSLSDFTSRRLLLEVGYEHPLRQY